MVIVLFLFAVVLGSATYATGPGLDRVTEGILLRGRVAPGTMVAGRDLGGLDRAAATDILLKLASDFQDRPVELRYGAKVFRLRPLDLGVCIDPRATLERVWAVGRSGGLTRRVAAVIRGLRRPVAVQPVIEVRDSVLHLALIQIAHELDRQAVNAVLDQETGRLRPGRPGYHLVLELAERSIREAATADLGLEPLRTELPVEGIAPRVTMADLAGLDHQVIGQYTTRFDPSIVGRSRNIARAAASIDGEIIHPGEVFSFNETVGPTTAENGYEEAPELRDGVFVTGIGGGACQVSSTLYNSALLAGLEIVERHRHSRVLPYVEAGRDATIVYGGADFRFRNNTPHPLQVRATVSDGAITTRFLGRRDPGSEVIIQTYDHRELKPEIKEIIDPSLAPGQRVVEEEGVTGLTVTVARLWVAGEAEIRREIVSRDVYPAYPEVVRVGPPVGPLLVGR